MLRQRVEPLVEASDWSGVHAVLSGVERPILLSDSVLAYRYAEALYFCGRMEELADYASAYEERARRVADVTSTLRALNLAGIAAFELGQISSARDRFDELMDLSESEQDEEMVARAANNLGAIANLRGRRHEALAYYQLASTVYQRIDAPRGLAQTHHNIGVTYRDLGQYEEAGDAYIQAIELAESLAYGPLAAIATIGRAEAKVLLGDVELGLRLVERGLELAARSGDPLAEGEALKVRALATAAQDEEPLGSAAFESATVDLERAKEIARQHGNRLLQAEAERDLGRLFARMGREAEARTRLERAAEGLAALGATTDLLAVREELAQLS